MNFDSKKNKVTGFEKLYLTHVTRDDIYFRNLAADPKPASKFAPKHSIGVWLNDEDIIKQLLERNCNVKAVTEYDRIMHGDNEELKDKVESDRRLKKELMDQVRYYIVFTAYPRMRFNKKTTMEEPWPMVKLITNREVTTLKPTSLRIADKTRVSECGFEFHTWEWEVGKPCVAVLDELRMIVDESSSEEDLSYLDIVYPADDERKADQMAEEELIAEELPFD